MVLLVIAIAAVVLRWAPSMESSPGDSPADPDSARAYRSMSLLELTQIPKSSCEFKLGRVLARESAYTRHYITYRSGDLQISGVMNIPHGKGPFPLLVLNHGYIPPKIYTNGRGLKREQDYFARRGYAVLHSDYRNHAESDKDTLNDLRWRLGYAEDVIAAVHAIRCAGLPQIDTSRIGMLGHSMGGGITMQVITMFPDLIRAAALYAPVSAELDDNFNRWTAGSRLGDTLLTMYGRPEDNPDFWKAMSPASYFDRVRVPVLIQHGTNDESCPYEWSEAIAGKLRESGKEVTLVSLDGEKHEFIKRWPQFMETNLNFFDRHLKAAHR